LLPATACGEREKSTPLTRTLSSLLSLQKRCRPTAAYIEAVQTEVNATMRGILVDWLVEVRRR